MNKNAKKYIIIFLVSLVIFLVCAPLRFFGLYRAAIIESIVYAFATFFMLSKYAAKPKEVLKVVSVILLGRILLELPIRVINPKGTLISLMVTITVMLSIVLTGIVFYKRKVYVLLLSLLSWGYCAIIGHDNWQDYVSFGSLPQLKTISYTVETPTHEIRLDTLQKKCILLDFWTSTCGVCIRQMPEYQEFYNEYKDRLLVRSLFVRYKDNESISNGIQIINEQGCDFPIWSIDKDHPLLKDLSIERYPVVVIIKDNRIIFKGPLRKAGNEIKRAKI